MADLGVSVYGMYHRRNFLSTNDEGGVRQVGVDDLEDDFSRLSVASSTAAEYISVNKEHLSHFVKNAKFPRYCRESSRMATFSKWHYSDQSPKELARAGFFSSGKEDEVYCFYCGGRLDEWESNAVPWEEHALYFPRCEWMLQQKRKYFVEQIQSKESDVSEDKEVQRSNSNPLELMNSNFFNNIDMSILENRIRSFEGHYLLLRFTVADFAAAGFFYMRIHNTIKCYMCYVEIQEWRDNCSPLQMHQRKSPICEVVVLAMTGYGSSKEENLPHKRSNEKGDKIPGKNEYIPTIQDYRREFDRLLSFYHWPICPIVGRYDLAAAGFYWKDRSVSITVQCFACLGEINEWKVGENPGVKHKVHYPSCPFVMGIGTGNIKVTPEEKNFAFRIFSERDALKNDTGRSYYVIPQASRNAASFDLKPESLSDPLYKLAKRPHFYFEINRLKSFISWPLHHCVSLTTLAAAGFFCSNMEDQVTCFFCGGNLYQWEATDDPWEEHVRNLPHCQWLLRQKGRQFVSNVKKKYEMVAQKGNEAASSQRKLGRGEVIPAKKNNNKRTNQDVQPEYDLTTILQSDVVQVLVDMGFSTEIIRTVIQKRLNKGQTPYQDAEDLLSAIFNEDESNKRSNDEETKHIDSNRVNSLQSSEEQNHEEDIQRSEKESQSEDARNELALLSQKLEKLEERSLCKVCIDNEVDVLFLPCKHLVVCKNCSDKLDECPICRTYIDEKVNVFMP